MWGKLRQLLSNSKPEIPSSYEALGVDMHSHLLPGLDDGASFLEESVEMLEVLQQMGFRKLCMTPHIMGDFYKNTVPEIKAKLEELQEAATARGLTIELSCAAEYFLDEWFVDKVQNGEELLTFGGDRKFILVETSYINEPAHFSQTMFSLQAAGYKPVLAHPERYTHFYGRFEELLKLRELGILFQINTNSFHGYYSKTAKQVAGKLVEREAVEFLGTDTHSMKHLRALERTLSEPLLAKALKLPLLNSTL